MISQRWAHCCQRRPIDSLELSHVSREEAFDSIAYINAPRWRTSSLGLDRIRLLMKRLGDPQRSYAIVHVAGTNGKGSTCSYLSHILTAAGCRTGLFTSPYIERFEERIRVDGADIDEAHLRAVTLQVRDAAEEVEAEYGSHPTEFEIMAAVAFLYFAQVGCQWAVVETGLGGRLDATNIVDPVLSVIVRIGFDHTDILGSTLQEIAAEKAGIIKKGAPVISLPQEEAAAHVLAQRCAEQGCELTFVDLDDLVIGPLDGKESLRSFWYKGRPYRTQMLGRYQGENAACALEAAYHIQERLSFDDVAFAHVLQKGIEEATWAGRFECISRDPFVIVDGGHNPQGARALMDSLEELGIIPGEEDRRVLFVIGVLADKDYEQMIREVLPVARECIAYAPDNPRALASEDLRAAIEGQGGSASCAPRAAAALKEALKRKRPEDIIVAFGTLYGIGEIKGALRSLLEEGA